MKWSDGSEFIGEWFHDSRVFGRMKLLDGTLYEGCFQDDVFHGRGKMTLPEGISVEGEFEKGKTPRKGRIIYKNGDLYEGEFR